MVNSTGVNINVPAVSTASVSGVNNDILNNTNSVFQNNVLVSTPVESTNVNNKNNNSRTDPVSTSSTTGLTYRALNNNAYK